MSKHRISLFAAVLAVAMPGAVRAAAVAQQITSPAQQIPGSTAQGRVGDWLLANDFVRVVLDDIANPHGFANTGGNIIDAATATGEDRFASMFTMFDNRFGRQANYDTLTVVDAGGGPATAHIRVSGVDSSDASIVVVTDYTLGPDDRFVKIVTTLTNTGSAAVAQLQVGDANQWGLTDSFAPGWNNNNRNVAGDGYDIGGVTLNAPWVAGNGQGSSYGVTVRSGTLEVSNGSTWSDTNVTYLDLAASGGTGSYERYYLVGDGSVSSVSDLAFALRGTVTGTLSGTVTENATNIALEGVTAVITTSACLGTPGARSSTVARTDASGQYSVRLEPGTYYVQFEGIGRAKPGCDTVSVSASATTTLDKVLSRQGFLQWDVRDAAANPIPAKISLLYEPLTPRREGPTLGDTRSLVGGYSILSPSGAGSTAVPPGSYRVTVSRGIEYEPVEGVVTVTEAATTQLNATLNRVVSSAGYVSADMHVHGTFSADSAIPWEDRIRGAAAEGLEIVVPTDHDFIADIASAVSSTGLGSWVGALPGDEVTTNLWGHFNAYPLTPDPGAPRNGALDHEGLTPGGIFSALRGDPEDPVVQVNHPRAGGLGYFDLLSLNPITGATLDPDWSDDFEALEVFNGKRLHQVPIVRNDWYRLLNNGRRVTGVGNTDTHQIFGQEIGYPRNFVLAGVDDPSTVTDTAFRDAVREGRTFFTNAPFVETWVNGQGPGSLVTDSDGQVDLRIRIQAPAAFTVDTVRIVVNGRVAQTLNVAPATGTVLRLDQVFAVAAARDSWIAVEVEGGECAVDSSNNCLVAGCPGRLDPIVPPLYGTDPVCPYAHTNPVYVDADADGSFEAPGNLGLQIEPIRDVRPADPSTYAPLREGQTVTVRGTVTAGSYTFDHRSNTVYFQDDSIDLVSKLSGGVTLYQSGLIDPIVVPGDRIEVTGTLSNFNGLLELTGVATTILERGAPVPDPTVLTVSQIVSSANREQWEGMLVRLNGVSITSGTWPGFGSNANLTVNDGTGSITLRVDSDTDLDGSPPPVGTFDVIAVLGQFDTSSPFSSGYQLLPRRRVDLVESGDPVTLLHGPAASPVYACQATIRWYTNVAADSTVEWGPTPSYGSSVTDPASVMAHSMTLSGLLPNATYHYRVISNGVASADATFTTTPSSTPALIAGPTVSLVDETTAQVAWTTDAESTSLVRYGASAAYGATATGPSGTTRHWTTLAGLTPGTTYHFRAESVSTACGGGTLETSDGIFSTPFLAGAPPEVSGQGSPVAFTLSKEGTTGLRFRFQWRGSAVRYHLWGAGSESSIDSATWDVKVCDLAANPEGTFTTDGATFAEFVLADGSILPTTRLAVVAENATGEGPYGRKSNGAYRAGDADRMAPTMLGCPSPCPAATASIDSVLPSTTVTVGTEQTFYGSGTGQGSLTYEWDFDHDGSTFHVMASGSSAVYTYPFAGTFTAALRVTDSCANPVPQQAVATVPVTVETAGGCGPLIRISQVYGGGGNSGATYKNDFIELFNGGDAQADLNGWSVQYASSTGSTWQVTSLSGSIPPGGYYLVQEAAGSGGTVDLPAPDAVGGIPMSSSSGKVALVQDTTALSGTCPSVSGLIDFVGYGTANCFEGAAAAPGLSNTTSDSRLSNGCQDTNQNFADFSAGAVSPRNSASAGNVCGCP
jgi:hypothetical protein